MQHIEDAIGYIKILEIEGEDVTAKNLGEAAEVDTGVASQVLKMMVRKSIIRSLGGDPVKYKSI